MKKIITFLGTSNYDETIYEGTNEKGEVVSIPTRFIQEAISEIVGKDAVVYIGLTEAARDKNWISREHEIIDYKTGEKAKEFRLGLKETLEDANISHVEFNLKEGKNEKEMWENFETIFNLLDEGDELYVDVTHSFRSIPFIIMSILNYAKFTKNIVLKGIYYGAYEARVDNIAPIFNLSLFNQLTDWTIGAEKFISTGDSSIISQMIFTTIEPILARSKGAHYGASISRSANNSLKKFTKSLYAVRGNTISKDGNMLKRALEAVEDTQIDELKPFEVVLGKIYDKVSLYSGNLVEDINTTTKLCIEFGLIQQAYTFLQENILNYLCIKGGYKYTDYDARENVKTVLLSRHKTKSIILTDEQREVENKLKDYINQDLANFYDSLSNAYRNDINHAGYRVGPKTYDGFYKKIKEFSIFFDNIIFDNGNIEKEKNEPRRMFLIFSHNLTNKQREDAKSNLGIEEFIQLPTDLQDLWSSIPADTSDITPYTETIKDYLLFNADKKDYVLVQGDFGATYDIVNHCIGMELIPVYSTTNRIAKETIKDDGKIEITHIFEHVGFREY